MIFEKQYTRDTSIIIQQLWQELLSNGFDEFGWRNPYVPSAVDVTSGGAVEVWQNREATEWIQNQFLSENQKGRGFFDAHIGRYTECLNILKAKWPKGFAESSADLKEALEILFDGMRGFTVLYYPTVDNRTPAEILNLALPLRDTDTFFSVTADGFIRKSLATLYPEYGGLETLLLRSEIEHPPTTEVLLQRKNNFIFIGTESYLMDFSDFQYAHPEYVFAMDRPEGNPQSIKGSIAYPGRVRGIVKIFKTRIHIPEVKVGDILVSPMTTPDFLSAMKIASAFVTDEGGVTCHAAIIARELRKPCIVGTRIATQVFKDGDLIEVDADKGVVTILKRA
jgi:phosphohistidine swiveling domain-containing protein